MTIKEQITSDLLVARKEGNQRTANLLRTILGEFGRLPTKDLSDDQAIKVLQKIEKNLNEVLTHGSEVAQIEAQEELKIVGSYLPKTVTIEELSSLYTILPDNIQDNIGLWMKSAKEFCLENNLAFDGKNANIVFKILGENDE